MVSDLGMTVLLPQALGLEPISVGAYYHEANGEPISRAERARIAQELAAQRFWIVSGGGLNYWDRHFVERAQIVLILLKPPWYRRLAQVLTAARRTLRDRLSRGRRGDVHGYGPAYEGIAAGVEHDKTQAEFFKRVQASPYSSTSISTPNTTVAGRVMLERYPEKTVVVSSMAELRQLRALRIRRAWPDAGQPG